MNIHTMLFCLGKRGCGVYTKEISLNRNFLAMLGKCMGPSYSSVYIGEKNGTVSYMFVDMNMMIWLRESGTVMDGLPSFNIDYKNQQNKISRMAADRINLCLCYDISGDDYIARTASLSDVGVVASSFRGTPFSVPTNIVRPGGTNVYPLYEIPEGRVMQKHWDTICRFFPAVPVPTSFGVRGRATQYATWSTAECTITCVLARKKFR